MPSCIMFNWMWKWFKMHLNKKDLKSIWKTCSQKYQKFLMLFWPNTTSKPGPNSSFPPLPFFRLAHRPNSNQTYEFWWLCEYRNKWMKNGPDRRSSDLTLGRPTPHLPTNASHAKETHLGIILHVGSTSVSIEGWDESSTRIHGPIQQVHSNTF